jgi:hypothetical protein
LFENINRISFDGDEIIAFSSAEKETIKMKKKVKLGNNPVEKWLMDLQLSMLFSVKRFIRDAHAAFKEDEEFKRHKWVLEDHPAQSICVVGSIMWCGTTEALLKSEDDVSDGMEWWAGENVN